MSDLNAYWYLQRANSQLENANKELNRPSEDIVAFSVCHQSKEIIADLMRSFLLLHGVNSPASTDLESLRRSCSDIEPKFASLNLNCMSCHPAKTENDKQYCMDIAQVKSCVNIADEVKDLVDASFRKKEDHGKP